MLMIAKGAYGSYINKELSNRAEKNSSQAISELEKNIPSIPSVTMEEREYITVDGIDYIGKIEIEDLSISLPVIRNWDYEKLNMSPCKYKGSVETSDLVIAAHNYQSQFGKIHDAIPGTEIIFTDVNGIKHEYITTKVEIISPYTENDLYSGNWDLTLFTCTNGGQMRYALRADKKY